MTLASTGPLIGRARELERFQALVEAITTGSAATLLIEGEAGIGKTRLLTSLIGVARERGLSVFHGAAHPLERIRPFGVLVDALDLRSASSDPLRAALGRLLIGEDVLAAGDLAAGQLQFRVVEDMIDLIEMASDHGPVIVALDDLHWADTSTLLAFRRMTRELAQVPLLLVATLRPSPRTAELAQLLDESLETGAQLIRVEPLDGRNVGALVQSELGLPPGPALTAAVGRAAGNPLWVVEMLRSLSSEGLLDLSGSSAELESAELPVSLRNLVVRRLGYLPERTAAALRSASILGEAFSLVDLTTVSGRRSSELAEELGEAIKAGLLADSEGRLAFRHQLVRDAIYEDIPEAARIALHREAGRTLEAAGASLSQVAGHLILGAVVGDLEAALSLRRAARDAAPRAPGVAVELLRRTAALLPSDHPARDVVIAELVDTLMRAGQVADAAGIAEDALARVHDEAVGRSLRFALIEALSLQNRAPELIEWTQAELTSSPEMPLADQAFILGHGCYGRTFSGDLAGSERVGRRALEIAERSGDAAVTVWSLTALSNAIKAQGRFEEAVQLSDKAVRITLDAPDDAARYRIPFFMHGMALADADLMEDAARAYRRAAQESEELKWAYLLPDIQMMSAELRFLLGDWEEAQPELEAGVEAAREHGNMIVVPRTRAYLALIAAARGNRRAAEMALAPVETELTSDQPCFGAEIVGYAASVLAEASGNPAIAIAVLRRFWDYDAVRQNRYFHRYLAPALVRLALGSEQQRLARHVADGADQAAALAPAVPSVQSAARRCRGLIERDPDAMLEAVELARRGHRILDHAGTCEDAAAVFGAQGRLADAHVLLAEALDLYDTIGADWYAARANASLRAFGARRGTRGTRGRAVTGWDSLTKSERSVAELVAEGLTNRAVGKRLFISPHTVNSHLRHSFQKLDVSTRAALAAKVSRAQPR